MKIGIIGMGYWGNIILRNLESMGFNDFIICDISNLKNDTLSNYEIVNDYKNISCDFVFVITPTNTHFKICKYFLEKNINVFCEKPLTTDSSELEALYSLAFKNNVFLFTDWIFTFNSHIEQIKKDFLSNKLGNIKSIIMNRLNLGPERFDVNARWDLASHDVSIIQYLFSQRPLNIQWIDYKRNKESKQEDSALGLLTYENFTATINSSWYYRKKVRECIFEFENFFVIWDDYKKVLEYEDSRNISFPVYSGNINYPCNSYQEPLKKAINSFLTFSEEDMKNQMELTIETIKILEVK